MAKKTFKDIVKFYDEASILFDEFMAMHYSLFDSFWTPAADLFVTDEAVCLMIEIAGVKKEDLTIFLAPTWIHVRGLKESPKTYDQGVNFYKLEIPYGFFQKRVALPYRIEPKSLKINLKDGLLTLRMRRKEKGVEIIKVE